MNDDLLFGQILQGANNNGLRLRREHTVGEQVQYAFPIASIGVVEVGIHTHREVCAAFLQVIQCPASRFQFDDIGNVELFHEFPEQVYVIAVGLSMLIQKDIRPQVPGIYIDQGLVL